ncbi:MAG TPA: hypothetical protein VNQ73_03790 [Ilumatobacter sp.]|nr:hypothetical protein [Ilumatobacter sp.]
MPSRLLPPPVRSDLPDDEVEAFDRVTDRFGGVPQAGYFGALLHSPPVCAAVNDGSVAFRAAERRGTLTTEFREWIDIVVGHELGSPWLIIAHLPAAIAAGLDPGQIRAVCNGDGSVLDGTAHALVPYVRAVVRGEVDDAGFSAVVATFGVRPAVEITAFACWVAMNTRLAQALGQAEPSWAELDLALERLITSEQREETP